MTGMGARTGDTYMRPLWAHFSFLRVDMKEMKPSSKDEVNDTECQATVATMVLDHIEYITSRGGDGIKALKDFIEAAEFLRKSPIKGGALLIDDNNDHIRAIKLIMNTLTNTGWRRVDIEDAVIRQAQTLLGSYSGEYPEGAKDNDR